MSEATTWMCLICGWIYDEATGEPEHGVAPGNAWADVPMNWTCPECGIDRDFCYLRRCGLLGKIGGVVLGQFSDMRDSGTPFGFTFEDIIAEHTKGLNIPILMNAPFGHAEDLYALPIGAKMTLRGAQLIFP